MPHPYPPTPVPADPLAATISTVVLRVTGYLKVKKMVDGHDYMLSSHVELGRGGLVELDELPSERSRRVSLRSSAITALNLFKDLFGIDYNADRWVGGRPGGVGVGRGLWKCLAF